MIQNNNVFHAIILVAGFGTRLRPLTHDMPKCLTEVNGTAILDNALNVLEQCGIQYTTLVIGYLGNIIKERIGDIYGTMKIHYIENNIYDSTNTSYSLWRGLRTIIGDCSVLVLEGDVFFEKELLVKFINYEHSTATVVQKYNPRLDGSFVKLNKNYVIDWIHKSARKPSFKIESSFKTVNIHKFDRLFLNEFFMPALEEHVEKSKGKEAIEFVFQDIVTHREGIIYSYEVGNSKWFEIDDMRDLMIAEEIFK